LFKITASLKEVLCKVIENKRKERSPTLLAITVTH